MNTPQLEAESYRPASAVLEITLVVTLCSLIVFGTLATIIKMDDDLIAVESITQRAGLPQPEQSQHSLSLAWGDTRR